MSDNKKLCLSGKNVTKVFGLGDNKTVAVNHIDFEFKEGELISIVGESGSGKTTLAKMLLGLLNPSEGDIYYHDRKISIADYKRLLAEHQSKADNTTILLLADQESRHGKVVTLMDLARDAGFVKLAIATEQRKP